MSNKNHSATIIKDKLKKKQELKNELKAQAQLGEELEKENSVANDEKVVHLYCFDVNKSLITVMQHKKDTKQFNIFISEPDCETKKYFDGTTLKIFKCPQNIKDSVIYNSVKNDEDKPYTFIEKTANSSIKYIVEHPTSKIVLVTKDKFTNIKVIKETDKLPEPEVDFFSMFCA